MSQLGFHYHGGAFSFTRILTVSDAAMINLSVRGHSLEAMQGQLGKGEKTASLPT